MSFTSVENLRYELIYDVSSSQLLIGSLSKSLLAYQKISSRALHEAEPSLTNQYQQIEFLIESLSYNSPFKILAKPWVANVVAGILITLPQAFIQPAFVHYLNYTFPLKGETESSLSSKQDFLKPLVDSSQNKSISLLSIDNSTGKTINAYKITQPQAEKINANLREAKKNLDNEEQGILEKQSLEIDTLRNRDAKPDEMTTNKGRITEISPLSLHLQFTDTKDLDFIRESPLKNTVFLADVKIIKRGDKSSIYKIIKIHKELTLFTPDIK